MSVSGKIDIGMALFTSAVLYCLIKWRVNKNDKWFVLSVLFCAFGFGVKYTGAFLLLLPASFYVYECRAGKTPLFKNIKLILASAAVYLLFVSPWLVVNAAFTNNPVSPYMAAAFKDKSIVPAITCNIANGSQSNANKGYFLYLKDVFLGMPVLFFVFFLKKSSGETIKLTLAAAALYLLLGNFFFPRVDRLFFPAFVLFLRGRLCRIGLRGQRGL